MLASAGRTDFSTQEDEHEDRPQGFHPLHHEAVRAL
jgi:hypothetical protein